VSPTGRGPAVGFPPPLLFAVAYLVAWLLDRYVAHWWPDLSLRTSYRLDILGWTLVITGLALAYWGIATFLQHRTAVYPNRDAKVLVVSGPYRFSRNPMYTGIIMACIGGCPVISSLWPLVTVSIATVALYVLVIRREEAYLTTAFAEQYREYQRQVGRWFSV
jgi:protein-S-isoprenylcysteine O-methyltransferase Ste14